MNRVYDLLEELEVQCSEHDFSYASSDDMTAFEDGESRARVIKKLYTELSNLGAQKKASEIIGKYSS